ncbi:MAG: hypothetical protein UW46_C0004G0024 [Candidatus Yanofskybacteria bacterium GW2011_GWF1_44_227]|nr:MAG: hypothetical protein UW46_C0004G0024 [Candidatus Yanofskybacteria bacterium GW2011_GWF1_44_227]
MRFLSAKIIFTLLKSILVIPRIFFDIKKRYHVDTLEEILGVIPEDKIIVLDLKSKSITKTDILDALRGKKYKKVILGNTSLSSVSFLERFNDMPEEFVKVMNGNIFCKFYDLAKLKDKNYGLFFSSKESYWNKINKYNIKHVSSDFI